MFLRIVCLLPFIETTTLTTEEKPIETTSATTTRGPFEPEWFYEDESHWPGSRCHRGKRQSPIDIHTKNVIPDFTREFIKYGPLRLIGYKKVLVSGINNGHTIQFSTEGDESMHPIFTGGPLKHVYRLEQLHFHRVSEHAINGKKYPMELHFVHVRSDLTVIDALDKKDGLAILSVFGRVLTDLEADIEDEPQQVSEFMPLIPKLLTTGDRLSGVLLDMTKLMNDTESYYTYAGSLTSPKCNEVVTWIIFTTPINVTDEQYRLFEMVGGGRKNFRNLQNISHHVVYTPADTKLQVPQIAIYVDEFVKTFADAFKKLGTFVSHGIKRN